MLNSQAVWQRTYKRRHDSNAFLNLKINMINYCLISFKIVQKLWQMTLFTCRAGNRISLPVHIGGILDDNKKVDIKLQS